MRRSQSDKNRKDAAQVYRALSGISTNVSKSSIAMAEVPSNEKSFNELFSFCDFWNTVTQPDGQYTSVA